MLVPEQQWQCHFFSQFSHRDASNPIVTVKVGPEKKVFHMHKKLLCNTSGFFQAVLSGNSPKSTKPIEIVKEDAEIFSFFQSWAYNGIIKPNHWRTIVRIYIFAEERCIPGLQNGAMDVLIGMHKISAYVPIREYRYIYEKTAEKSPLRRFLAEWVANRGLLSEGWFNDRTILPVDFIIDLALALYGRIPYTTSPTDVNFWQIRYRYHTGVVLADHLAISAPSQRHAFTLQTERWSTYGV